MLLILGTCLDVITNKKKAVNGLTEIGHKGDGHVENGHTENGSVETGHTENGHVENAKNDECDDLPLINVVVPKEQCNCIFQILDTNGVFSVLLMMALPKTKPSMRSCIFKYLFMGAFYLLKKL